MMARFALILLAAITLALGGFGVALLAGAHVLVADLAGVAALAAFFLTLWLLERAGGQ